MGEAPHIGRLHYGPLEVALMLVGMATMPTRARFLALACITILAGLLVHSRGQVLGSVARDILGDALWAMMAAWWIGAMAPRARLGMRCAAAYAVCVTVELSQLYHAAWLDGVRATWLGRLVLGSGFDARDLAAYGLGVGVAALIEVAWRRSSGGRD